MSKKFVALRGIDPLLFRDAKPFGAEQGAGIARSLPLPQPSTVAGALRTSIGNTEKWTWNEEASKRALAISVAGPLLCKCGTTMFPKPADALIFEEKKEIDPKEPLRCLALRPKKLQGGAGCDAPNGIAPMAVTEDVKPESGHHYWTAEKTLEWLESSDGTGFVLPTKESGPLTEDRVNVGIDIDKGVAKDGALFSTRSLCFERHPRWNEAKDAKTATAVWEVLAQVDCDTNVCGALFFGGERRIAVASEACAERWTLLPLTLRDKLGESRLLRLQLATPALFRQGWIPDWLEDLGVLDASLKGARLKLASAAIPRREPVSGWDYHKKAPKAVRWMVPAGAVYFFEVEAGRAEEIAEACWLQPVSDGAQDRLDGYGLALWGVWNGKEFAS